LPWHKKGLEAICSKSLSFIGLESVFDWRKQATPIRLKEAVDLLEITLSDAVGGNAGGNISVEQRDQIFGWADLFQRVQKICDWRSACDELAMPMNSVICQD
jgi:hypothetical protein